jgi:hypothetical protein
VGLAGGQEDLGVRPGEAGHDSARSGQVQLLQGSSAVGIGPVHQEFVVEPEIEGPERHGGGGRMVALAAGKTGEEGVEVDGGPGAGHEVPVENDPHPGRGEVLDARNGQRMSAPGADDDTAREVRVDRHQYPPPVQLRFDRPAGQIPADRLR